MSSQTLSASQKSLDTSDFQSEVGEVFGEIGGELPAKFGRRFSSFFCWGKSSEALSTKTPPQISPSNFTTRFWVVAGPKNLECTPQLRERERERDVQTEATAWATPSDSGSSMFRGSCWERCLSSRRRCALHALRERDSKQERQEVRQRSEENSKKR